MMPMWSRRNRASAASDCRFNTVPATSTSPSVGRSRPATRLSKVDFPLPDGPITATDSPAETVRSTPSRASGPAVSYRLLAARSRTSSVISVTVAQSGPSTYPSTDEPRDAVATSGVSGRPAGVLGRLTRRRQPFGQEARECCHGGMVPQDVRVDLEPHALLDLRQHGDRPQRV